MRRTILGVLAALGLLAGTPAVAAPASAAPAAPVSVSFGQCITGSGQPKLPVTVTNRTSSPITALYGRNGAYADGFGVAPNSTFSTVANLQFTIDVLDVKINGADYQGTCAFVPASQADCPPVLSVSVRGSGEKTVDEGGYGATLFDFKELLRIYVPIIGSKEINYPAINVPSLDFRAVDPLYVFHYLQSVSTGIQNTRNFLRPFVAACPLTKLIFDGFSQGAQVAGDVFQGLPADIKTHIYALVLFGDPRFNPKQTTVDQGTYDPSLSGIMQLIKFVGVRTFSPNDEQAAHNFCTRFDPVCGYSLSNVDNCSSIIDCAHLEYPQLGYTETAAQWASSKVS